MTAEVNFATETAHVEFDAARTAPEDLIGIVRRAGYDAAPARDAFAAPDDAAREAQARQAAAEDPDHIDNALAHHLPQPSAHTGNLAP